MLEIITALQRELSLKDIFSLLSFVLILCSLSLMHKRVFTKSVYAAWMWFVITTIGASLAFTAGCHFYFDLNSSLIELILSILAISCYLGIFIYGEPEWERVTEGR